MFSGQGNLKISDVTADRRGSSMDVAPGHLIYIAAELKYDAAGKLTLSENKNITISDIKEGAEVYSNVHSGGTLAIKYLDGGSVTHVIAHHPVGLLQTLASDENVIFRDMNWQTDYHLCEHSPEVCQASVINSYVNVNAPDEPPLENLTFEDITLKSSFEPITCTIMGHRIIIKNLTIETPPWFKKGQTNANAVLSVKQATDVTVTDYHYIPVLGEMDTAKKANAPFGCWTPCKNVTGGVDIKWPNSVPTVGKEHPIVRSVFQGQDVDPGKHVVVTTQINPKS
jgi:hypothetical protein